MRKRLARSWPSLVFLLILVTNTFELTPITMADDFHLPAPGVIVSLSPPVDPPLLKGIKVHSDNPFEFDFILDKGNGIATEGIPRQTEVLKNEAAKLIKYFLASVTIPQEDLWVNLSPYEKDRVISKTFGLTEMGRDLLAEDYLLKQVTASLIYPEGITGKKFWKRIYEQAVKKYETTNIPVNTFNKVWIVPEKAVVYENTKAGTAYIVTSHLKVMLEQDYLARNKNISVPVSGVGGVLGSQIIREIVIPELTAEVNQNKNFSRLRQVYNSLILATWYKNKIRDSLLEHVYADKNKIVGIQYTSTVIPAKSGIKFKNDVEGLYQEYLRAFKKGAYNYIKDEIDPATQNIIPRKYFSGGMDFGRKLDQAMVVEEGVQAVKGLPTTERQVVVIVSIKTATSPEMHTNLLDRKNAMLVHAVGYNYGAIEHVQGIIDSLHHEMSETPFTKSSTSYMVRGFPAETRTGFGLSFNPFNHTVEKEHAGLEDLGSPDVATENLSYEELDEAVRGGHQVMNEVFIRYNSLDVIDGVWYKVEGENALLTNTNKFKSLLITAMLRKARADGFRNSITRIDVDGNWREEVFTKDNINEIINSFFEFRSGEFKKINTTPEALIRVLKDSGVDLPGTGMPIDALNKVLSNPDLYKNVSMVKRPEECSRLINRMEQGQHLMPFEVAELNRLLIESNYSENTPQSNKNKFTPPAQVLIRGLLADDEFFKEGIISPATTIPVILPHQDHQPVTNTIKVNGGIDLTAVNILQAQNSGGLIKFHINPFIVQQLKNTAGFVPVIIDIQPLKNLQVFLGLNEGPHQ